MSILTYEMARARLDTGASISDNLKLFFPCNEGVGDTITDTVGGVVITDAASIEYTNPYSSTIITNAAAAITGTWPVLDEGQSMLFFKVQKIVTMSALSQTIFGAATGERYYLTPSASSIADGEGNYPQTESVTLANAGDTVLLAIGYDGVAKTIKKYAAVNLAPVTKEGNTVDASSLVFPIQPPATVTLSSSGAQHYYSIGMYVFDGALPDQDIILSELDRMYAQHISGTKEASTII